MIYESSWLNNTTYELNSVPMYDYGSDINFITSTTHELSDSIEKL